MPEPLFHDLQVGAAGQQPRRVRMSQVVHPDGALYAGGSARGPPHDSGEPVPGQVAVTVDYACAPGFVLAGRPSPRPVGREHSPADFTPAAAGRVRRKRGVQIGPSLRGGCGPVQLFARRGHQPRRRLRFGLGEQQVLRTEITFLHPGRDPLRDGAAELESPRQLVLRVGLDQKAAAVGVELRVQHHDRG